MHIFFLLAINYHMNVIWTTIVILCFAVMLVVDGNAILPLCVDSARQGAQTALELVAVYSLWLGVFSVAEKCKVVDKLAQKLGFINKFLYGKVPISAQKHLTLNLASNLLGVGNAATPSAISAINIMEQNSSLGYAGAMLFVLNANGVQLIPTTVMSLRASLGSQSPTDIFLPTLICTVVTAVLGVVLVKFAYGAKQ